MTGSGVDWRGLRHDLDPSPGPSDRAFGLLFAAICGAVALFTAWEEERFAVGWALAATALLALAVLAPPLLGSANRAWRWFSLQLSRFVNPIIMCVMFFVVLTPIGIVMRLFGNDPLRLRFDPQTPSYWLPRAAEDERQTSMTRQF
jgi:hypothetical protein